MSVPEQECDLVMQGGVTSGIVYPPLVLKLKDRYVFRNVAGTSAGAIAAAATAAAEHGRARGGFEALAKVSRDLADPAFLVGLFQPSLEARPLFRFALDLLRGFGARGTPRGTIGKAVATVAALGRAFPVDVVGGGLAGAALAAAAVLLPGGLATPGAVLPALTGFVLGAAAAVAWAVARVLRVVEANGFGLCSGLSDPRVASSQPALVEWLGDLLETLAGRPADGAPLSFGDLERAGVRLRMVTSALTQLRPYVLPFDRRFVFRETELRDYFPARVVAHLVERRHVSQRVELPPGFHFLPEPEDLPVVFAARLSLGFPILFRAVPLYTIDRSAFAGAERARGEKARVLEAGLQRHWFSDGGICSNFPIHFFDAWLPRRPTFGICLTSLPDEGIDAATGRVAARYLTDQEPSSEEQASDDGAVQLPRANQAAQAEWVPVKGLLGFLWNVFLSAQTHHDNALAELPSARGRIVRIRLADSEGGLNLAMQKESVLAMIRKGERAGEALLGFDLPRHQWVRLRVLFAELERELRALPPLLASPRFDLARLLKAQLEAREPASARFPYPRDAAWCDEARARLAALEALVEAWTPLFEREPPRPRGSMRIVPGSQGAS